MKFEEWFEQNKLDKQFFDTLEKLSVSPSYTEEAVEFMKKAFEAGANNCANVAEKCAALCDEQSKFLLRFSQFGANAAKDCANLIREVYHK